MRRLPFRNCPSLSWPLLFALALGSFGCAAEVMPASEALVYDDDNRQDVFATMDDDLAQVARTSVGAVVDRRLVRDPSSPRTLPLSTFVESQVGQALCEEARFREQPVLATCSGVLLTDELFMTASHCIPTQEFCNDHAVVFGWHYESEGRDPSLTNDEVYRCDRIEVVSYARDYVVIRLRRPVVAPYGPATFRTGDRGELRAGERVSVLGYPSGIPLKIDDSGEAVQGVDYDSFTLFADVFEGHSGAPVFDNRNRVVGIVSQGDPDEDDYEAGRGDDGCASVNAQDTDRSDGITAAYTFRAVRDVCANGGPASLCDGRDWCPLCTDANTGCSATGDAPLSGLLLALIGLAWRRRRLNGE